MKLEDHQSEKIQFYFNGHKLVDAWAIFKSNVLIKPKPWLGYLILALLGGLSFAFHESPV